MSWIKTADQATGRQFERKTVDQGQRIPKPALHAEENRYRQAEQE